MRTGRRLSLDSSLRPDLHLLITFFALYYLIPLASSFGLHFQNSPGTHFWAEYYIEGYGWIPCDPTVAEVADRVDITGDERAQYKEYFVHNLDNTRFVIQKDVDVPMIPEIPDDAVVFSFVRQNPGVIYDESDKDVDLLAEMAFSVDLRAENL